MLEYIRQKSSGILETYTVKVYDPEYLISIK